MEVNVGDLFLAHGLALLTGTMRVEGEWMRLGNDRACCAFDDDMGWVIVTLLSITRPDKPRSEHPSWVNSKSKERACTDFFTVLLPDGRVARIFDDRANGYWASVGDDLERAHGVWMNSDANTVYR
jgi:hypothetical protein